MDEVVDLLRPDGVVNLEVFIAHASEAADGGRFAAFPATRGDNARYVLVVAEGRCDMSWSFYCTFEAFCARKIARVR